MQVFWLTPLAWWGFAALAIPVVIHLLTRQKTRRVPFPTLRFLRATRLAALRRRSIHDWPLLIVRLSILAAAVAALAGPVFVSNQRQAEWARRVARAVVVAPVPSERMRVEGPATSAAPARQDARIAEERTGSFVSAVFRSPEHVADGLRDAVAWLERQPPAAREIVITGDLREAAISEADIGMIPASVGLRFLPTPTEGKTDSVTVAFTHAAAAGAQSTANVTLLESGTRVTYSMLPRLAQSADVPISVRAAAGDLALAIAARDAVLTRGVRLDRSRSRRVLVVFDGGDVRDLQLQQPAAALWMRTALGALPGLRGGQHGDTLVVLAERRANDPDIVHVVNRIARATFTDELASLEPRRISAATLAVWSRPPGPVEHTPPADEGDRRWLWGAALLLMLVEAVARRSASTAPVETIEEERVA